MTDGLEEIRAWLASAYSEYPPDPDPKEALAHIEYLLKIADAAEEVNRLDMLVLAAKWTAADVRAFQELRAALGNEKP